MAERQDLTSGGDSAVPVWDLDRVIFVLDLEDVDNMVVDELRQWENIGNKHDVNNIIRNLVKAKFHESVIYTPSSSSVTDTETTHSQPTDEEFTGKESDDGSKSLQELNVFVKNLSEQLAAQDATVEQLKAEKADLCKSVTDIQSKLEVVAATQNVQLTTASAQQGHVTNLDTAVSVKLVTIAADVADLRNTLKSTMETAEEHAREAHTEVKQPADHHHNAHIGENFDRVHNKCDELAGQMNDLSDRLGNLLLEFQESTENALNQCHGQIKHLTTELARICGPSRRFHNFDELAAHVDFRFQQGRNLTTSNRYTNPGDPATVKELRDELEAMDKRLQNIAPKVEHPDPEKDPEKDSKKLKQMMNDVAFQAQRINKLVTTTQELAKDQATIEEEMKAGFEAVKKEVAGLQISLSYSVDEKLKGSYTARKEASLSEMSVKDFHAPQTSFNDFPAEIKSRDAKIEELEEELQAMKKGPRSSQEDVQELLTRLSQVQHSIEPERDFWLRDDEEYPELIVHHSTQLQGDLRSPVMAPLSLPSVDEENKITKAETARELMTLNVCFDEAVQKSKDVPKPNAVNTKADPKADPKVQHAVSTEWSSLLPKGGSSPWARGLFGSGVEDEHQTMKSKADITAANASNEAGKRTTLRAEAACFRPDDESDGEDDGPCFVPKYWADGTRKYPKWEEWCPGPCESQW